MIQNIKYFAFRRSSARRWIPLVLLGIIAYLSYQVLYVTYTEETVWLQRTHTYSDFGSKVGVAGQACRHPHLDMKDPEMMKFFTQMSTSLTCDEEPDWVCLEPGKAKVCQHAFDQHKGVSCKYTFFKRRTDFSIEDELTVTGGVTPITLQSDYFRVKCTGGDGATWENVMAGIRYEPEIVTRSRLLPSDALGLNVMIWGHDSISRMTFMRTLPKTYKYLTEVLSAIVLKGYNIVGDGTPEALIPILTGKTERELPETRRWRFKSNYVDVYPFIWKEFKTHGYVTAFAEDRPDVGTFTYRMNGFLNPPTDHYLRPFYLAVSGEANRHKYLCLRGTPRHKVLMNWVRQFMAMYSTKPKFSFSFHNEMSHDDVDQISAMDDDLLDFLHRLHDKGTLNNTVLIVMSDHGSRYSKIRETRQGPLEERMPMFSFVFPPWFEKKYPIAMNNFRQNAERLTTPFDIYPTLYNILHFEGPGRGSVKERGISLFKQIPLERTCADADIEPHWCACMQWQPLDVHDDTVKRLAFQLLKYINNLTETKRKICEVLTLDKIIWANKFSNQELVVDGIRTEIYQVKIHTLPGEGHFEATLYYRPHDGSVQISELDISRVNKYGHHADCVFEQQPQLRKYCYCKTLTN